jgi:23S rRNA (cytosine1962-C5)-methyltransferase
MNGSSALPRAIVTPKAEKSLRGGHPWVSDTEIVSLDGEPEDGGLAEAYSAKGRYLGTGFYNSHSKIRVRLISENANDRPDAEFWRRRVRWALEYRKTVMGPDLPACRLIHGEADRFPGLTVDLFEDTLVVECLCLGTSLVKDLVLSTLVEFLPEYGVRIGTVYERSEGELCRKEGMEPSVGFRLGLCEREDGHVPITENCVRYDVDFIRGQKTGFFLDQKYNRLAMQRLCKGMLDMSDNLDGKGTLKVLDCFTHMGTFALNCAKAGATNVTGLDISEFAVGQATENAVRNNLEDKAKFRCANVLDELPKLYAEGEKYDLVILDPPAFTKSREATKNAIKGYREINMKGMKLVRDGGYLATCSCSHFMTEELFKQTILQAAKSVHKRLTQVEFRTQAPDHPILWAADESYYLKFIIFRVTDEK